MKNLEDIDGMSEAELLAELERIRQRNAKRPNGFFGHNERKERIERDPTAYFTRPKDFERAERRTEGATAFVPRWNHTYTEPTDAEN